MCPSLRARVRFSELNRLDSFYRLGRLDVISCRKVLIYFAAERKDDIIQRMGDNLTPGGYLFLGGTESITVAGFGLELISSARGSLFRKC